MRDAAAGDPGALLVMSWKRDRMVSEKGCERSRRGVGSSGACLR